jgi:2-C-methyl-D-erythritol 4-phosphate cytidylyltransferase
VKVALLLLAAGRGARFGGEVPKVYLPLSGKPVLLHSAERLLQVVDAPQIRGELVVVVAAEDRARHVEPLRPALAALGARLVAGGATRQQSMQRGLEAASPDCDLVLIHDAARPLFPVAAARACIERAAEVGAALLAVPAPDTLKRASADGFVEATIDRRGVHCAQTPQIVRRELLARALQRATAAGVDATDDVGLVEALGQRVAVVAGSPGNLKITQPHDLALAAALLHGGLCP